MCPRRRANTPDKKKKNTKIFPLHTFEGSLTHSHIATKHVIYGLAKYVLQTAVKIEKRQDSEPLPAKHDIYGLARFSYRLLPEFVTKSFYELRSKPPSTYLRPRKSTSGWLLI
jgi:hypothetical protein